MLEHVFILLLIALPIALLEAVNSHVMIRHEQLHGGPHIRGVQRVAAATLAALIAASSVFLLWWIYALLGERLFGENYWLIYALFYGIALLVAAMLWGLDTWIIQLIVRGYGLRSAIRLAFRLLAAFTYTLATLGLLLAYYLG